jgi:hypothetical protein
MKRPALLMLALLVLPLSVAMSASAPKSPGAKPARKPAVPFLQNDYPRALEEARARGVPIFIDAWAPW